MSVASGLDSAKGQDTIETVHPELHIGSVRGIEAVDIGHLATGQDALMHPGSLASLLTAFALASDLDDHHDSGTACLEAAEVSKRLLHLHSENSAAALRRRSVVTQAKADRSHPS